MGGVFMTILVNCASVRWTISVWMVLSFESACSSVVCPNATPSTPITVSPLRSKPSFATSDREDMRSTILPVGDKVTGSRPLRSAGHSICSLSLDVSLSTKLSVIFTLPSSADSSVKPVSLWTKPASFRMFAQLLEALVDRAAAEYCIPGATAPNLLKSALSRPPAPPLSACRAACHPLAHIVRSTAEVSDGSRVNLLKSALLRSRRPALPSLHVALPGCRCMMEVACPVPTHPRIHPNVEFGIHPATLFTLAARP